MSTSPSQANPPQQLTALRRANEIRLARAELRRRIASGELFAASVLLDPPAEARTWPVSALIVSQRQWGATRARKLLARNRIPELKPVGALTERQRLVLARMLGAGEGLPAVDGCAGEEVGTR